MKKIISIAIVVLLFSGCRWQPLIIAFGIHNRTSQTLLVSFFDGETEIVDLMKFDSRNGRIFKSFDAEDFSDADAAFYSLWHSPESEFRVYSADTVLLKVWKPDFNPRSKKNEFYRKSDWEETSSFETAAFYFPIREENLEH